jgi:hypothetical protein
VAVGGGTAVLGSSFFPQLTNSASASTVMLVLIVLVANMTCLPEWMMTKCFLSKTAIQEDARRPRPQLTGVSINQI